MTNESTEAVLELCLQTQHENTKRAILNAIDAELGECEDQGEMQRVGALKELRVWIDELKLEDTK